MLTGPIGKPKDLRLIQIILFNTLIGIIGSQSILDKVFRKRKENFYNFSQG